MTEARRVIVVAVLGCLVVGITSCGQGTKPPPWAELSQVQHDEAERLAVPVRFENELGMRFVLIPAGTFTMGSPEDEEGREEDETQHEVTISKPFYLQITEVTNGQYQAYKQRKDDGTDHLTGERKPAVRVSWLGATAFAEWLSSQEARQYRLPTEAEWEWACRAGTSTPYSFGGRVDDLAQYASIGERTDVASKLANEWGLYDMHGNVSEWCFDWHDDYPTSGTSTDPVGPTRRMFTRVVRGSSWWSKEPRHYRSAFRGVFQPNERLRTVGFRLVSPVPEEGK